MRYETREVLAVAYPTGGVGRPMLSHTVRIARDGYESPLCGRVKRESIADGGADPAGLTKPPTCKACMRRDPRFNAAPAVKKGKR